MAITTEFESRTGRARASGDGLVLASDTSHSIRQARRHSHFVRVMRVVLPFGCVAVIGIYAAMVMRTAGWGEHLTAIELPRILPENLTMDNPRYEGFNKDGGSYVFAARSAQQDLGNFNLIKLNDISGDLVDANKVATKLTASRGVFDNAASKLELFDGINVVSDNGMRAQLKQATVLTKENVLFSTQPVVVEMPAGTIRSNAMTLKQRSKEVSFTDQVIARLKPQERPGSAKTALPDTGQPEAAPTQRASATSKLFGAGGEPVDVTADKLDIDDAKKTAIFSGGVKAVQGEATLTTPALLISYEGETPAGQALAAGSAGKGAQVRRLTAAEPVTLTQGEDIRATSKTAEFDAVKEIAHLIGNVVMTSAPDRRATGDHAEFNAKDDTALITGDVVITQGKNEMKGRRLFLDRKSGETRLTAPPDAASGPGRISARFHQSASDGKGAAGEKSKSKKEPAAAGQSGGFTTTTFKTNPDAPVDVTADVLDADDKAKVAIFRGDVQAEQGDFMLRTAELHASYSGEAGLAATAPQGSAPKEPARLTRIQAKRKVVVTSKNGQNASGDWADFDTAANTVTLGGDVVLTQGPNVIRGSRLVIDMTTGESVIKTDTGPAVAAPLSPADPAASAATGPPSRGARPSAIFYPKQTKEALDAAKNNAVKQQPDRAKAPTASSSWDANTQSLSIPEPN